MVRDHLALQTVDYLTDCLFALSLEDRLESEGAPTRFDLVVLGGLLYHTFDPLVNIMVARRLVKPDGLVVIETAYHLGDAPVRHLNWAAPKPINEDSTYMLPTVSVLQKMLRFSCLEPIATALNGGRVAVLARAAIPDELSTDNEPLRMLCSRTWFPYSPINFMDIHDEAERSQIEYTGRQGTWKVDRSSFQTTLTLQPKWSPAQLEHRKWYTGLHRRLIRRRRSLAFW